MINNWIKIGFRNYRKSILFTFINVLGLTVGIIGIILTSLYWNDELSYNSWNPGKEEIYSVAHLFNMGEQHYMSMATVPEGAKIKEILPEVEDYLYTTGWLDSGIIKTSRSTGFQQGVLYTTENFFTFFPFEFIHGNAGESLKDLQSVAISENWMNTLFNGKNPVGEKVEWKGKEYVIKGVFRIQGNSSVSPEAVFNINWTEQLEKYGTNWGLFSNSLFLKIRKGTAIEDLAQRIDSEIILKNTIAGYAQRENMSIEDYVKANGDHKTSLDRLSGLRLFGKGSGGGGAIKANVTLLYILTGLSLVILILSCFNYINLTTASSVQRAKEVGIRKVLGGTKKQLIAQFVLENFILCLGSMIIALGVVETILPYFNLYFDKNLKFEDSGLFGKLTGILLVVIILSGIVPALYLSNFKPLNVLKGNFSRSRSGVWLRNAMLGLQFVISSFFFICGLIIYQQVDYMSNRDLGFKGDQLVAVSFHDFRDLTKYRKYELIKQEFKNIPGVAGISSSQQVPAMMSYMGGKSGYAKTGKSVDLTLFGAMDYNFPDLMGLTISEGRNLSPDFSSDSISNVMINETLAKQLGMENPINEKIDLGDPYNVVGVVKDYFVQGFDNEIQPTVYFHWNTMEWTKGQLMNVVFKMEPQQMESALKEIESRWNSEIEPGYPFSYKFVDQEFANTYEEYRKQQKIFMVLSIAVVAIALLGLFGLVSFVIEQRMHEFAIRKALGATQADIIRMFSKKYTVIAGISILASIPLTYYLMRKWLDNFVYRIDMPVWPYLAAFIILVLLAFAVTSIRTGYAARLNPAKYLKYE